MKKLIKIAKEVYSACWKVLLCDILGILIGVSIGFLFFPSLREIINLVYLQDIIFNFLFKDGQTFWTFLGAIATTSVVIVALYPIWTKARLGKALFEDAVQIDIGADGVFRIFNIFDEPVVVKQISQVLITGSTDLGLARTANTRQVANALNNLPSPTMTNHTLTRSIAPGISFAYAATLTHLPAGYQTEALWVVKTKIKFESRSGKSKETQAAHRFSIALEPRNRWIEVL